MNTHRIGDVTVLNDQLEVPGIGFLPVNAYVLHAQQKLVGAPPGIGDGGLVVTEWSRLIKPGARGRGPAQGCR